MARETSGQPEARSRPPLKTPRRCSPLRFAVIHGVALVVSQNSWKLNEMPGGEIVGT